MAKKMKPSLKGYLKTGEVHPTSDSGRKPASAARIDAFLDLLAPTDLEMWKSILGAGTAVQVLHLDVTSFREEFRAMDRSRFTCYSLAKKNEPLCPIRSDSQIQDHLMLLLKWDETGILTVYDPSL